MIKKRWLIFVILLILCSLLVQAFPFLQSYLNLRNILSKQELQKRFNDYNPPNIEVMLLPKYMLDFSVALLKIRITDKKTRIISVDARIITKNKIRTLNLFDDGLHSDNNANDAVFTGYLRTVDFNNEQNVNIEITAIDQALNKITVRRNVQLLPRNVCERFVLNGNTNEKLDLLILGDKYSNKIELINEFNKSYNNIISFEPFKKDKKKFNIFYIDSTELNLDCHYGCYRNLSYSMCCDSEKVGIISTQCPNDVVGVIVNSTAYGGTYNFNPSYFVSYKYGYNDNTVVHEFGHAMGLMDEYDYKLSAGSSILPWGPNCETKSTCTSWAGTGGTGCFSSCTYSNWFRPIKANTLMYDNRGDYGHVNQKHLNNVLANYK